MDGPKWSWTAKYFFETFQLREKATIKLQFKSIEIKILEPTIKNTYITCAIYTNIRIVRCTFDVGIVSITTKPYILQKILKQ